MHGSLHAYMFAFACRCHHMHHHGQYTSMCVCHRRMSRVWIRFRWSVHAVRTSCQACPENGMLHVDKTRSMFYSVFETHTQGTSRQERQSTYLDIWPAWLFRSVADWYSKMKHIIRDQLISEYMLQLFRRFHIHTHILTVCRLDGDVCFIIASFRVEWNANGRDHTSALSTPNNMDEYSRERLTYRTFPLSSWWNNFISARDSNVGDARHIRDLDLENKSIVGGNTWIPQHQWVEGKVVIRDRANFCKTRREPSLSVRSAEIQKDPSRWRRLPGNMNLPAVLQSPVKCLHKRDNQKGMHATYRIFQLQPLVAWSLRAWYWKSLGEVWGQDACLCCRGLHCSWNTNETGWNKDQPNCKTCIRCSKKTWFENFRCEASRNFKAWDFSNIMQGAWRILWVDSLAAYSLKAFHVCYSRCLELRTQNIVSMRVFCSSKRPTYIFLPLHAAPCPPLWETSNP